MNDPRQAEFERLAADARATLTGAALRMTHDRDDAEDLVQETLRKAWVNFDAFVRGCSFPAWAWMIMRNINVDQWRKGQLRICHYDAIHDFDEFLLGATDPGIETCGLTDRLLDAVNGLPRDMRAAVLLKAEGLSQEEIALDQGVQLGTVKTRIHRGRQKLRETLSADDRAVYGI